MAYCARLEVEADAAEAAAQIALTRDVEDFGITPRHKEEFMVHSAAPAAGHQTGDSIDTWHVLPDDHGPTTRHVTVPRSRRRIAMPPLALGSALTAQPVPDRETVTSRHAPGIPGV